MLNYTEVYAVPGAHSLIDVIDPSTGLTWVNGHTEAEVQARDPLAVRMAWADWQRAESASQRTPITWERSTHAKYHEMLNILPPAAWIGGAFLVGEPYDHDVMTGQPRFQGYWERVGPGDRGGWDARGALYVYLVASRPMTIAELHRELQGGPPC